MNKQKLTKTGVDKIALPDSGTAVFWDSELTGFGLRVSAGGTKTYFYQGRINGRAKKVTIGRHGPITAEAARKEAKRMQASMELGKDPKPPKAKPEKRAGAALGDLLTAYVDLLEMQGKQSARAVSNQIHKDVEAAFPKLWAKPAAEISLDDCMAIIGALKDADKPRAADKLRSYIRTAYSEAINARGDVNMPASMRALNITTNPARDMRKVKGASNAKDRALSLAEFRAYWRRLNDLPEPARSLGMIHVLTGGQRQKQMARATLHDIDRDGPSLILMDYKGRRQEPRRHVVPLLPDALECIDRITGGGEYVFSCDGGRKPVNIAYMGDLVAKIREQMEQAGEVEKGHFTAGSIRATVETRLAAKPYRVSSDTLAHLLSHGLGGVQARHYQHHDFYDEKLEALQMLHRMVEGEAEPVADVIPFNREASA